MPVVMKTLIPDAKLSSEGLSLVALRNAPLKEVPGSARPASQVATHGLQLSGYQSQREGQQQHVTLYWRAAQVIDVDLAISVRLMRGAELVAQVDSAHPVDGYYPMTRWAAGEVVRDDYAHGVPAETTFDRIQVNAYRTTATGFENLAEFDFPP
jgi:hypothetical protein